MEFDVTPSDSPAKGCASQNTLLLTFRGFGHLLFFAE